MHATNATCLSTWVLIFVDCDAPAVVPPQCTSESDFHAMIGCRFFSFYFLFAGLFPASSFNLSKPWLTWSPFTKIELRINRWRGRSQRQTHVIRNALSFSADLGLQTWVIHVIMLPVPVRQRKVRRKWPIERGTLQELTIHHQQTQQL
jgi:hypothetical protein